MSECDRLNIIICLLERFSFDDIVVYENETGFLIFNQENNHYIRGNVVDSVKTFSLSIGGEKIEFITHDVESFIERYFSEEYFSEEEN